MATLSYAATKAKNAKNTEVKASVHIRAVSSEKKFALLLHGYDIVLSSKNDESHFDQE